MNQPDKRPTFGEWVKAQDKAKRKRAMKEAKTKLMKSIKQGARDFLKSNRFDFVCYFWLLLFIITLIIVGLNMGLIE